MQPVLGKLVSRQAILDEKLAKELKELADPTNDYETFNGKTMCASDFYEGNHNSLTNQLNNLLNQILIEQGRLDGAFCDYTREEKLQFLKHLNANGVLNIEMEICPFAALTHRAGIKSAVVCVTLLNRLLGDQVN